METIIINGHRELKDLPELWYTDGTKKANEWAKASYFSIIGGGNSMLDYSFYANNKLSVSNGANHYHVFESYGHTYITYSEFRRLVYEPWKESQKVKLPSDYDSLFASLFNKTHIIPVRTFAGVPEHINSCIQLTNIMNFANDAFEGDGLIWVVGEVDRVECNNWINHPIRFTSKAAAEWAYKTFPEIFKAYWKLN
jgi:hypothetical protein